MASVDMTQAAVSFLHEHEFVIVTARLYREMLMAAILSINEIYVAR
jgi:hypothetical protein